MTTTVYGPPNTTSAADVTDRPGRQLGHVVVDSLPTTSSDVTDRPERVLGSVVIANFPATQNVTGTVAVSNLPATQAVTGTVSVANFPATQAVSGTVAVSNLPATQTVSGSVSVANLPATQPVSEAHLPNLDVTVSSLRDAITKTGATVKSLADVVAALQATLSVSGTVNVGNLPVTQATDVTDRPARLLGKVATQDSAGQSQFNFPAGFVRTSDEPRQILYDPFDGATLDPNAWAATSGNSAPGAGIGSGNLTLGTGTVANGYSTITSVPSFKPVVPGWIGFSSLVALPDGAAPTANAYRFMGAGTFPAVPTVSTPVTNGYGFEITTAGKLMAVVYVGGVRTQVADLSGVQPSDANLHRYILYVRTDRTIWYIDSLATPVASTSGLSSQIPAVQTLPATFLAIGGATPPASNAQIVCSGTSVWDTGKNATQVADGTYPWRRQAVSASGAASVANTDLQSRFYRLLNQMIPDGNEMRTALQAAGDPNSNYFGTAVDGSTVGATAWDVLRIYLDASGNPTRWRTLHNVAWSNAILGDTANPVVW